MEKEQIKEIVRETIAELSRQDRLKSNEFDEAQRLIRDYYAGEAEEVGEAIKAISKDQYAKLIPLHFKEGYTIEQLAVVYDCEVSTINRNKKRLCLEIYRRVK